MLPVQVKKLIYVYVWALNILLSSFIFPFVDPRQPEQGESGAKESLDPIPVPGLWGGGTMETKKENVALGN